jgi:hypothetical protein
VLVYIPRWWLALAQPQGSLHPRDRFGRFIPRALSHQ